MIKDYYMILNISYPSNYNEIQSAYRKQSKKWHPDKNYETDTTKQMQDINEAYNILIDKRTKYLYDNEYIKFKQTDIIRSTNTNSFEYNYDIKDENLKQDINKANKAAKTFVSELLKTLRTDSNSAVLGAWNEAKNYILSGIIMAVIIFCVQMCS